MKAKPSFILILLGLSMLGATCKGSDRGPEASANRPSEPDLVAAPTVTEIPGLDLSVIPPAERAQAVRVLNSNYCYCGCARTLAACLAARADCSCVGCSERMTNFILNQYQSGASTEDVEAQLLEGFSEGFNGRPRTFDVSGQAVKGASDAKITMVEFADFRCPHCADAFEVVNAFLAERDDVKLHYYYYPLSGGGELSIKAAEAAEEARKQGKFWEMAALLFENQMALEPNDLETYALKAGLNLEAFKAAMASGAHRKAVMADKRLGESLGVMSTPYFFVDGRPFGLGRTEDNFNMRAEMELSRGKCD